MSVLKEDAFDFEGWWRNASLREIEDAVATARVYRGNLHFDIDPTVLMLLSSYLSIVRGQLEMLICIHERLHKAAD